MVEHVLVRGERNGAEISRKTVVSKTDSEELYDIRVIMGNEHHGDPPSQYDAGGDVNMDDAMGVEHIDSHGKVS